MNMIGIPRIAVEELKRRLHREEGIVLLDVRKPEAYHQSHIQGALSFPAKEAEARLRELPLGRTIVCY